MKTNKQAISLIVLVVTIIVMAILASTVVISLSNANIIQQANKAVKDYNAKQYEEILTMAYASYIATTHKTELDSVDTLEAHGLDKSLCPEGYTITIVNGVPKLVSKIEAAYPGVDGITEDMIIPASVFTYSYNNDNNTAAITGYAGVVEVANCMSYTLDSDTLQAMTTAITAAGGKYIVPYEVVNNGTTYTISGAFEGYWGGAGDMDRDGTIADGETKTTYTMFDDAASGTATEVVLPATINSFYNDYATPAKITITTSGTVTLGGYPYGNVTFDILNATALASSSFYYQGSYAETYTINVPSTVTSISSTFLSCDLDTGTQIVMNINKAENSISGYPWGMTNTSQLTVNWAE